MVKIKVCFIAPKAYPVFNPKIKSTFGGAEVQFNLFGKELAKKKDLDINFMVADYGQKKIEFYDNIKIWNAVNFKKYFIFRIINFFFVFRKINADIYIQTTLTPFSGLMALYCKLLNKKFVYMLSHDKEVEENSCILNPKDQWYLSNSFANLTFKFSILIITQNEYQQKKLSNRNINPVIIKYGYLISKEANKKDNYILWVGRSENWKQPELFLKLADKNPKFNFVMICPPATNNPVLSVDIKNKSKKIKNLKFFEYVPFNEIDRYFRKAKIFVNTSTQEGFPNTFIQSTKNKTPILSLNINPDNFLNRYKCGLYCNNNFNQMNKNLNKLLNDKKLYCAMSKRAYEYAKANHDIKKNAQEFYETISELK